MTIVTTYDQLPENVRANGDNYIPANGQDLLHTYNLATDMWQAHCTCCGEYTDDTYEIPATDHLCDDCAENTDDDF